MVVSIAAKLTGATELAAKLRAIGDRAPELMLASLQAGALLIQNDAKQRVPKKTRTLSRSIIIETVGATGDRVEVRIGPTEPYGKYVEYGTGIYAEAGDGRKTPWVVMIGPGKFITTRGQRARPFMRPALDENREAALAEMRRVLAGLLSKEWS